MKRCAPLLLCGLLFVLLCPGLARGCDWDLYTDRGLDPAYEAALALRVTEASDQESCLEACCKAPDCDLALMDNGGSQCRLVRCVIQDRDVCVLQPRLQSKVFRKNVKREAGTHPRVVPLLLPWKTKSNETDNIRCRLPMKVGSCRAAFPKFYYDVTNRSCRSFIYGGCDANANNFQTEAECEAACSGVQGSVLPDESTAAPELHTKAPRMALAFDTNESQDAEGPVESEPAATVSAPAQDTEMSAADFAERCGAEPQVGPCRAAFKHWYYNSETGNCQSFIYGGCRGNKNNYASKESCMATCTAVKVLPSSKKVTDDDEVSKEYKDDCMVTSDPGPCRAAFPMFYYDPKTSTCQSFIYGGCRGNQNRYGTMEECMSHCSRKGFFDTRGKARDRWTPAIFLFITLAAISALLLVTLVITLRRHNLSHRPSSISDKEELLPDPDEHSSLESLTVPESPKPGKA